MRLSHTGLKIVFPIFPRGYLNTFNARYPKLTRLLCWKVTYLFILFFFLFLFEIQSVLTISNTDVLSKWGFVCLFVFDFFCIFGFGFGFPNFFFVRCRSRATLLDSKSAIRARSSAGHQSSLYVKVSQPKQASGNGRCFLFLPFLEIAQSTLNSRAFGWRASVKEALKLLTT